VALDCAQETRSYYSYYYYYYYYYYLDCCHPFLLHDGAAAN